MRWQRGGYRGSGPAGPVRIPIELASPRITGSVSQAELRALADRAWDAGQKDLATALHDVARTA